MRVAPTRFRARQSLLLLLGMIGYLAWSAAPGHAMIVTTTTLDTTQPPSDNPGWNNVTVGAWPNFTYLGNGWALSAYHVGPGPVTFSTGTFSAIPGQIYDVPNPAGLSATTDLTLIRLSGNPGLPGAKITSLSQPPAQGSEITFIGQGRTRQPNLTNWDQNWVEVPGTSTYSGYYAGSDYTKRWGKNQIANENALDFGGLPDFGALRGTVHLGGSVNRDVVSMFTQFNSTAPGCSPCGIPYEAQAADLDSGTAVFYKNGSQWELVGVVNTVFTFNSQPFPTAVFGTYTSFADLTFYKSAIDEIMHPLHLNEVRPYSIAGDVNLDGAVTAADVTAFVQGWNLALVGGQSVEWWKRSDLNLDGVRDYQDFFAMRNALINAGLGSGAATLSSLLGPGAVPEPATIALVAAAAGFVLSARRARQ